MELPLRIASSLALLAPLALVTAAAAPTAAQNGVDKRITPVVEVVQSARPAVVYIQTQKNAPVSRRRWSWWTPAPQQSSGSGVVIYEDGYIVTNYHVVRGAERIQVSFDPADDPNVYPAELISFVQQEDLALLKISGDTPFPTIPLSSEDPLLGETVIAIGNPYGQTHTVSTGIISGLHRNIEASGMSFQNLLQTDASINPGNSGGPLININGELIGINTAMNLQAENIGFAIPIARVRRVLRDYLIQADSWLGFDLDPATFVVGDVTPNGPGEIAGLRPGDRLLQLAGRPLESDEDYNLARLSVRPKERVRLDIVRDGRSQALDVEAWTRLDGLLFERLGMTVERAYIGRNYRSRLQVAQVAPSGPAAELGLQRGDLIAAVQPRGLRPKTIGTPEDFAFLVSRLQTGDALGMEIWRDEDGDGLYERNEDYSELYQGTLELR